MGEEERSAVNIPAPDEPLKWGPTNDKVEEDYVVDPSPFPNGPFPEDPSSVAGPFPEGTAQGDNGYQTPLPEGPLEFGNALKDQQPQNEKQSEQSGKPTPKSVSEDKDKKIHNRDRQRDRDQKRPPRNNRDKDRSKPQEQRKNNPRKNNQEQANQNQINQNQNKDQQRDKNQKDQAKNQDQTNQQDELRNDQAASTQNEPTKKEEQETKRTQATQDKYPIYEEDEKEQKGLFARIKEAVWDKGIKKILTWIGDQFRSPIIRETQIAAARAAGEEAAKKKMKELQNDPKMKDKQTEHTSWNYEKEPGVMLKKKNAILDNRTLKDEEKLRELAKLCHREYKDIPLVFMTKDGQPLMMKNEDQRVVISRGDQRMQAVRKVGPDKQPVQGEYSVISEYAFKERGYFEYNRLGMERVKESDYYSVLDDMINGGGIAKSDMELTPGARMRELSNAVAQPMGPDMSNDVEVGLGNMVTTENLFYHPEAVMNALKEGTAVVSSDMVFSFAESTDPNVRLAAIDVLDEAVHGPAAMDQILNRLSQDNNKEVADAASRKYDQMIGKQLNAKISLSQIQTEYLINRAPMELKMTAADKLHLDALESFKNAKDPELRVVAAERGYGLKTLINDPDERVKAASEKGYDFILKRIQTKNPLSYDKVSLSAIVHDQTKEDYLAEVAKAASDLPSREAVPYVEVLKETKSAKVNEALGFYKWDNPKRDAMNKAVNDMAEFMQQNKKEPEQAKTTPKSGIILETSGIILETIRRTQENQQQPVQDNAAPETQKGQSHEQALTSDNTMDNSTNSTEPQNNSSELIAQNLSRSENANDKLKVLDMIGTSELRPEIEDEILNTLIADNDMTVMTAASAKYNEVLETRQMVLNVSQDLQTEINLTSEGPNYNEIDYNEQDFSTPDNLMQNRNQNIDNSEMDSVQRVIDRAEKKSKNNSQQQNQNRSNSKKKHKPHARVVDNQYDEI